MNFSTMIRRFEAKGLVNRPSLRLQPRRQRPARDSNHVDRPRYQAKSRRVPQSGPHRAAVRQPWRGLRWRRSPKFVPANEYSVQRARGGAYSWRGWVELWKSVGDERNFYSFNTVHAVGEANSKTSTRRILTSRDGRAERASIPHMKNVQTRGAGYARSL